MYFKPYYLGCLAHASYLIGGSNGEAAVIDPRRDIEEYVEDAKAAGLTIAHVIETHLHADFVSGHVELARRTGATIHIGSRAEAGFAHHPVQDGDQIDLGDVTLKFIDTPGHTPESVSILAIPNSGAESTRLFSGDTLFIGDVGRPDLAGSRGFTPNEMAHMMFRSLTEKIISLPENTEVWPAHGAGSSCGKALSDDRVSTIGREKATNPALQPVVAGDEDAFVTYATEGLGTAPSYFGYDAQKNRSGADSVADVIGRAKSMTPHEVEEAIDEGIKVLDVRSVKDFGAGHVPTALHVQLDGKFAPWVAAVLSPTDPIILVSDEDRREEALTRLARIGFENVVGVLEGGMTAWTEAGGEIETVGQWSAAELRDRLAAKTVDMLLDVRSPGEYEGGHVDGAVHIPLPELAKRIDEIGDGEIAVICGSGYRSSIACSVLQRAGRRQALNVVGGWGAWCELAG